MYGKHIAACGDTAIIVVEILADPACLPALCQLYVYPFERPFVCVPLRLIFMVAITQPLPLLPFC